MRKTLAIAALLLLAAPGAQADDTVNCKTASTTFDLDVCAGKDFQAVDAKLNAAYRQLMTKYDAEDRAVLKTAQKSWLAFRDAECTYETFGSRDGTMNAMLFTMCKTEKTSARIKDFNAQIHCAEGDLSCNAP